ncbi:hypothetical protein BDN72DRAFT_906513 [Pluteus cervinus]|uniref:Uncharacterized protein n=1 Tax=Pluteus cervinus TaxID=181527 RepID=A0ACD2ZZ39_9AGAR|nr:hypothetical protein BDN72DRAFT_906513 [Pluteus cervinus]
MLSPPGRDIRYPTLQEIDAHPLVSKTQNPSIRRIIVCELDTSPSGMQAFYELEEELKVPFGPNADMKARGLIRLVEGDVLVLRKKGCLDHTKDVVGMWVAKADRVNPDHASWLIQARELVLGEKDKRTLERPHLEPTGNWVGGTAFERLQRGQTGVKGCRCYSQSLTHQCWRGLVGPTAGAKDLDRDYPSDNIRMRNELVNIYTSVAMDVHEAFAPSDYKHVLEETAKVYNTPRVGSSKNVISPSLQVNIAPAVEEAACRKQGLEDLGEFGSENGHRDENDTPGALTTMIVNSDLPATYERGRFHILGFGIYVELDEHLVISFSGLYKHGGSPPIAPQGEPVQHDAYRLVAVCYPPEAAMTTAGSKVVPLASLPMGELLDLGPEITNPM